MAGVRVAEPFAFLAGIHDANAVTAENPFDTIEELEFFYSAELRWFPTSFDRRQWDQVRLQAWYVDETDEGATPSGQGATLTASRLFEDRYMPFVSAGWSDGDTSFVEKDLTLGLAFAFNTVHRAARDVLGFGVNWSDPADGSLEEQYTAELFYRFQLFQNLAFTPSFQFIESPALQPDLGSVWVGGIRGRLTF